MTSLQQHRFILGISFKSALIGPNILGVLKADFSLQKRFLKQLKVQVTTDYLLTLVK